MRFAKVTAEGEYVPPPPANSKASFSTMTYVRATIVEDAGEYLARAVTIAVSICSKTPLYHTLLRCADVDWSSMHPQCVCPLTSHSHASVLVLSPA